MHALALVLLRLQEPELPALDPARHEPATAHPAHGAAHATLEFVLVDPGGAPVADTAVALLGRASGWGGGDSLVARVRSAADGHVRFANVSVADQPLLAIGPPGHLRPELIAVDLASFGTTDLGRVALRANALVCGTVERVGLDGQRVALEGGYVRLVSADAGRRVRAFHALDASGAFVLDDFDTDGSLVLEVRHESGGHAAHGTAPFEIEAGSSRRLELRLGPRDGDERDPLVLRARDVEGEPCTRSRATYEGRVSLPDGSPAAGLRLALAGPLIFDRAEEEAAWDVTGADGGFHLSTGPTRVDRLLVTTPASSFFAFLGAPEPQRAGSVDARYVLPRAGPYELALTEVARIEPELLGVDAASVRWSTRAGAGWEPCPPGTQFRTFAAHTYGSLWRAEADGRLPRVASWWAEATPPVRPRFDFRGDVPWTLRVVSAGKPLVGARLDVAWLTEDLAPRAKTGFWYPREIPLASLATDGEGRVELLGDPDAILRVSASAPGCEPRVAAWRAGTELVLELAPRMQRVVLEGVSPGERVRVKHAGAERATAVLAQAADAELALVLAAGDYDASVLARDGAVLRGTSFVAGAAPGGALVGNLHVDLGKDLRPRVVLELPPLPPPHHAAEHDAEPDGWVAWATRRTPEGATAGAAAISRAGRESAEEPGWTEERAPGGGPALRLSGSGRWQVHLAATRGRIDYVLSREVDARPGETLALALPALDATLEGSMSGFDADIGISFHGVAGPRLFLLARSPQEGGNGWNVVVGLPQRVEPRAPRFRVAPLPAGRYDAFHHLARGPRWGGVPVELVSGAVATLADFSESSLEALRVEVVDARGAAVTGAALRVRDRMHEAWSAFRRLPTTGVYADEPLPEPPSLRLTGEPVELPVVEGRLELVVERDDGARFHYDCFAERGARLRLRVPD